jgi:hypothetical protein
MKFLLKGMNQFNRDVMGIVQLFAEVYAGKSPIAYLLDQGVLLVNEQIHQL